MEERKKKRIILIGRSTAGKTTLCQRLNHEELNYCKTQTVQIINRNMIDTTMFPPQFGTMFAKPCVGVVSKIDIATPQQIADAEAFLRAAGAGRIFRISSVTGEGVKALAEELEA